MDKDDINKLICDVDKVRMSIPNHEKKWSFAHTYPGIEGKCLEKLLLTPEIKFPRYEIINECLKSCSYRKLLKVVLESLPTDITREQLKWCTLLICYYRLIKEVPLFVLPQLFALRNKVLMAPCQKLTVEDHSNIEIMAHELFTSVLQDDDNFNVIVRQLITGNAVSKNIAFYMFWMRFHKFFPLQPKSKKKSPQCFLDGLNTFGTVVADKEVELLFRFFEIISIYLWLVVYPHVKGGTQNYEPDRVDANVLHGIFMWLVAVKANMDSRFERSCDVSSELLRLTSSLDLDITRMEEMFENLRGLRDANKSCVFE